MAVNFNQDSVFNLKPISNDEVRSEVDGLLIAGEQIEFQFKGAVDIGKIGRMLSEYVLQLKK